MYEPWLPLLGVLVGALVTVAVQRMRVQSQRQSEKREVLRAIAARALSASRETWTMLKAHTIQTARGPAAFGSYGWVRHNYLDRYDQARTNLDLALDELTLMESSLEKETEALRNSVKLGTLTPGGDHEGQERAFWKAHKALHASLAPLVRP